MQKLHFRAVLRTSVALFIVKMENRLWRGYAKYKNNVKYMLLIIGLWPPANKIVGYRLLPYVVILSLIFLGYGTLSFSLFYLKTNLHIGLSGISLTISLIGHLTKVLFKLIKPQTN